MSVVDPGKDSSDVLSLEEKRLLRRCDRRILPILFCLFVLSFLGEPSADICYRMMILSANRSDRVNIGNAKIQGLEEDLHMKNNDYNVALFVAFIPLVGFSICQGQSITVTIPLGRSVCSAHVLVLSFMQIATCLQGNTGPSMSQEESSPLV